MSSHHQYAPSSLELFEACALYEKQEWEDTSAVDEGTMMHQVLETGNRRLLETPEQEAQINKCFTILEDLKERLGDCTEHKEVRLPVVNEEGDLITRGTADLLLMSTAEKHKAILLDWKMGILPITPAEYNLQLQTYIVGLLQQYPNLEEVTGIMVAPRQDFQSEAVYTREDIPRILTRIRDTIRKREDPFKQPTCDETACALCKLRSECPALAGTVVTTSRGLGVLPLPSEFKPGSLASPLDRAKAQVLAKILEQWAVDIRRYNTAAVVEHGEEIPPGFSLRKRSGGFTVDSEYLSEFLSELKERFPALDTQSPEFLGCFKLSASKLGTLLSELTGDNKKDLLQVLNEAYPEIVRERQEVIYLQKSSKKISDEQILLGEITST